MGLKNEFESAVVNEPPVFWSLKFYCTYNHKGPIKLDSLFFLGVWKHHHMFTNGNNICDILCAFINEALSKMYGWMICDFTPFSTVLHSKQNDRQMIMKRCMQWSPVFGRKDFLLNGTGICILELGTAISVG